MSNVYVVMRGVEYEGDDLHAVFGDELAAKEWAVAHLSLLKGINYRMFIFCVGMGGTTEPTLLWSLRDSGEWRKINE